jgi:hypothetical protein
MFVRFRQTSSRLQLSVVETRRIEGKVRHPHVASLGTIEIPLTVAGRIAFWTKLHDRLAWLANRLRDGMHSEVLGAVHERISMVTADEQRALQLANAKADAEQWSRIHKLHASTVEDHKGFVASVTDKITKGERHAAEAAAQLKTAEERVEPPVGLALHQARPGASPTFGTAKLAGTRRTEPEELGYPDSADCHGQTFGPRR